MKKIEIIGLVIIASYFIVHVIVEVIRNII